MKTAFTVTAAIFIATATLFTAAGETEDKPPADKPSDRKPPDINPQTNKPPDNKSPDHRAAITAAKTWLGLVDAGKYSYSWNTAAELFKNAVDKEQWKVSLNSTRKPLGDVISRNTEDVAYRTELPGAPAGEYMIIQFKTSFKNKNDVVETVTPMKEKDGVWRVSGYFIK